MSPLLKDLLIKGLMAGTAVKQAKKRSVGVIYYCLAGCFAFLAFIYFTMAFHAWLDTLFLPYESAALVGLAVLAFALAIAFTGYMTLHKKKIARKVGMEGGMFDSIEGMIKNLAGNLEEPIRDNPKAALLMAALAGFAAGDKIGDKTH